MVAFAWTSAFQTTPPRGCHVSSLPLAAAASVGHSLMPIGRLLMSLHFRFFLPRFPYLVALGLDIDCRNHSGWTRGCPALWASRGSESRHWGAAGHTTWTAVVGLADETSGRSRLCGVSLGRSSRRQPATTGCPGGDGLPPGGGKPCLSSLVALAFSPSSCYDGGWRGSLGVALPSSGSADPF